ncbi:DUF104 domain-containing protein [bacterium]|nr:DUF104 domain-containing protein [bacterium]
MITVKGIYENGEIRLLSPINIDGKAEVVVTVFSEEPETSKEQLRKAYLRYFYSLSNDDVEEEKQLIAELSPLDDSIKYLKEGEDGTR